jgi:hypothetical protein
MTGFDYLSVLLSIVLGLGVANLLTGLAGMVRHRARITMFWPLPVGLVTLFLIHVQTWWMMYGMRLKTEWTIGEFLMVLGQPVLLYVMTVLIVPQFEEGRSTDLRAEFFRDRVWFFACLIAILLLSLTRDFIMSGRMPSAANLVAHGAFLSVSALAIATTNDVVHKVISLLLLGMLVLYIATLFVELR